MTEQKLVTIVIPCYNHGQFLKESVQSILAQTHQNIEVVIVNDGSADDTHHVAETLAGMDARVVYRRNETNLGKWRCLNDAIAGCRGEIVTCHDADDVALPNRIERQLKALVETESVHVLCGFSHCYNEEDVASLRATVVSGPLSLIPASTITELVGYGYHNPTINHYFTGNFETAGTTAMFYKELWNMGFRFNPPGLGLRVAMSEDSDFNQRVTLALRNTVVLAEKLYLYRRFTTTNKEEK